MELTDELKRIGIDNEIIARLKNHFGGNSIYFPKNRTDYATRNKEIVQQIKSGKSYREVSKKYDLTAQRIRVICKLFSESTIM